MNHTCGMERSPITDTWKWEINELNFVNLIIDQQIESDVFVMGLGTPSQSSWKCFIGYSSHAEIDITLQFLGLKNPPLTDQNRIYCQYKISYQREGSDVIINSGTTTKCFNLIRTGNCEFNKHPHVGRRIQTHLMKNRNECEQTIYLQFSPTIKFSLTLNMTLLCYRERHNEFILQERLGFVKCFEELFNNQDMSDVTVKCGMTSFYAHKLILSFRSSVFRAMFQVPMKESESKLVEIKEKDVEVVKMMLQFIYGQLDLTSQGSSSVEDTNKMMQLIDCAEMYNLDGLKSMCFGKLLSSMNDQNVGYLAITVHKYRASPDIVKTVQDYCSRQHVMLIKNPEYRKMYCQQPEAFLEI